MRRQRSSSGPQPELPASAGETLTIEGQAIDAEFRPLPVGDVELDLSNPRIQYLLKQSTKKRASSRKTNSPSSFTTTFRAHLDLTIDSG